MKSGKVTSVFNIPDIEEEDEVDYKKLYEKEKKMRVFYERKTRQLENKLCIHLKDNRFRMDKNKRQDMQDIMQDIKSFKSMLPNSVKMLPCLDSDQSIADQAVPPLIKEWAIYGLGESLLEELSENDRKEANTLASNRHPSQILEHTSHLVFPSGTSVRKLSGKAALECSLDIINLSKDKIKSFILTFEPTSIERKFDPADQNGGENFEVINILNPERKMFAVCIELDQFTVSDQENSMIELKTTRRAATNKSVKFKEAPPKSDTLEIIVSKRIYTIFTYYPFFGFFEELLKSLLYAVKVERYILYKEGGENLKLVDSKSHSQLIKNALEDLRKDSTSKPIVADKLLDFTVCGNNKSYLQLNREALTYNMAEEWAYYILSLFTLDVFLDLLTLIILEEKIVFVCTNAPILTHAIYLFTKVLIKPFEYPYPVVSLIPDQQEYLNAPFPVVYGYLKSREELEANKTVKRYKNVYVFFEPEGVEIVSDEDKKKVLNRKSPKLRDRLISKFKKMHRNYPSTTFFNFMQKKQEEFEYPVNIELAREILSEVHNYIDKDIFSLLPNYATIEAIKQELISQQQIQEDDLNREVFLKIKEEYSGKSKDPFFAAFLQTQLLNVHVFKY